MHIIWKHIRPLRWWVALSLLLAGLALILTLVDPLIFGRIIDQYALKPDKKPDPDLVRGAFGWLLVAAAVALTARLAKTFQEYVLTLVVQLDGGCRCFAHPCRSDKSGNRCPLIGVQPCPRQTQPVP